MTLKIKDASKRTTAKADSPGCSAKSPPPGLRITPAISATEANIVVPAMAPPVLSIRQANGEKHTLLFAGDDNPLLTCSEIDLNSGLLKGYRTSPGNGHPPFDPSPLPGRHATFATA
jgi:hypothetical protein